MLWKGFYHDFSTYKQVSKGLAARILKLPVILEECLSKMV